MLGIQEEIEIEEALLYRERYNKLSYYKPYEKQIEFHNTGVEFNERCLGAGNQTGKTLAGSMEIAMHATGRYPDWWKGMVFDRPMVIWVGGDTTETIRDTTQKMLVGRIQDPEGLGSGAIPLDCIIKHVRGLGVKDSLDHVKVKHCSGRTTLIFFKSYEKGRQKWQGETIDFIWFDEEPPIDIYQEGKTRTNNGQHGQTTMLTYTPLLGMTEVSASFYMNPTRQQKLTQMTIDDVGHYTDKEKQEIVEGYLDYERDARARGVPILGSGRIFPIAQEKITCDPFAIPMHFTRIIGADFGYDHPQGWVNCAYDRETDVIYITHEYRARQETPEVAAIGIRCWDVKSQDTSEVWSAPVAWPHDGMQHDKGSGLQLASQYRETGLNMHAVHATHASGGFGTEAGVMEMFSRMRDGRLKIFSNCAQWFEEFRLYHRKDGKIVKERDDLMSASRMVVMMLRIAEVPDFYVDDDDYRPEPDNMMGY